MSASVRLILATTLERIVRAFEDVNEDYLIVEKTLGINRSTRVDLKAFPVLRDRGSLYLEEFAPRYQYYESKECIRKLYLNLSLILNLCKSSEIK